MELRSATAALQASLYMYLSLKYYTYFIIYLTMHRSILYYANMKRSYSVHLILLLYKKIAISIIFVLCFQLELNEYHFLHHSPHQPRVPLAVGLHPVLAQQESYIGYPV